jgi:hypothetical protein
LPNEYLLELGRMVSVWGSLESTTALAISKLAGYDSPTDIRALAMVNVPIVLSSSLAFSKYLKSGAL